MVRSPSLIRSVRVPSRRLGTAIFLVTALAFSASLRNGFVWDDWALIFRTIGFRGFDARHLRWMLTTTHMANFTPLAWLSYAVDYSFWGLNPAGYHLTNLILHALNAALFYRAARTLLGRIFSEEENAAAIESGAAFAALAFALHPLRVESVAWASERRDVLSGFFFLATILFYARAALARGGAEASRSRALSIACFGCAALSKATVVPLPAALLALDYYPLKRVGAGESARKLRARLVEKIPYVLIAAAAAFMAVRAQLVSGNLVAVSEHGLSNRLAQALYGTAFYVWKTLLPIDLSALYPLAHQSLLSPASLGSLAAIAAVAGACGALGVGRRAQAAIWGYYLALLAPVLGLIQNGPQSVALRYSYLSCLGWALLAGCAAARAVRDRKKNPVQSAAAAAALGLWLASNAWAVQTQLRLWRDGRTLWESVLRRSPLSPDANMNLADALLHENEPRAAESFARIALKLAPGSRTATLALAQALAAERREPEAREELDRDLRSDPDFGDAHALLGVLLDQEGRDEEALAHLRRAAELMPSSAEAQANAGAILALRGRYEDALPYFEKASRIDPANPSYSAQLSRARGDLSRSRTNPPPPRR